MKFKRICPSCRKEFDTEKNSKVYCSPACRARAHREALVSGMTSDEFAVKNLQAELGESTEKLKKMYSDGMVEIRKQTFLGRLFDNWDNAHCYVKRVPRKDLNDWIERGWVGTQRLTGGEHNGDVESTSRDGTAAFPNGTAAFQ